MPSEWSSCNASPFGWEGYVGPRDAIIGVDHFDANRVRSAAR